MTFSWVPQGVALLSLTLAANAMAQQPPESSPVVRLVQGTLVAPGSPPFHLKAQISEGGGAPETFVELFWQAPNKLRRTIQSDQFVQTLVVNGDIVFEHDAPMYMLPEIQILLTAIADPQPIIASLKPGDQVRTKANGASQESGTTCFDAAHRMCMQTAFGLMESVGAEGRAVDCTNYRNFHGKRIARRLTHTISAGDYFTAEITELDDLEEADPGLFSIAEPTPPERRLHVEMMGEAELRGLVVDAPEIVWPQVLDGAEHGQASFYVSLDTQGKVREVLPLKTANERSNDSADHALEVQAVSNKWHSGSGRRDAEFRCGHARGRTKGCAQRCRSPQTCLEYRGAGRPCGQRRERHSLQALDRG